jgi:glycosyltransferase involved in cell wall biosynthesis
MRVILDHQIFTEQQYGGVSKYFTEIAARLRLLEGIDLKIVCPLFRCQYLRNQTPGLVEGLYVGALPAPNRLLRAINAGMARREMTRQAPDIVHETYFFEKQLAPPESRIVATVHDMIHEKFPQFFAPDDSTSALKRAAVLRADHVICVSENTRSDLIACFKVDPGKISVIHHGVSRTTRQSDAPRPIDRPYIAYVGVRAGYKNFSKLIQAFGLSSYLRNNFALLCFGGGKFTSEEQEHIAKAGLSPKQVIQLQGSDQDLEAAYAHAQALAYPSLYEGFGLPLLEAMAGGCPVICSNTSSLPEVCGDAAEYFDPYSPESISERLVQVLASASRCQELAAKGVARAEQFTWERCAKETARAYARTLESPRTPGTA